MSLRLKILFGSVLFLIVPLSLCASSRDSLKLKFDYDDVALDVRFDNREYNDKAPDVSRTLFGLRLDAALGLRIEDGDIRHRLIGGVSPLYEFGGSFKWQAVLYYELSCPLKHSTLGILAGAFQRSKSQADYSPAFYSDYNRFYDNTIEGFQFNWKGRNFYYELGLDWMGMYSQTVREEFSVYSGGHHSFNRILRVGYSAYLHHYACSGEAENVIDDILVSPWVEADFASLIKIQTLRCNLAYLQALQRDRGADESFRTPAKGRFLFEIRNWNVGLKNDLYFGADMMPYYECFGPDGKQYSSSLYMGDPMMRNASGAEFGIFDRVSVYWQPRIAKILDLKLQVDVDFNGTYVGTRQCIGVVYRIRDSRLRK